MPFSGRKKKVTRKTTEGRISNMKVRLQHILTVLFVLALVLGCVSTSATASGINQTVLTIEWSDDNNRDGLRPEKVFVDGAELNPGNGWTAVVTSGSPLPDVTSYNITNDSDPVSGDFATVTYAHTVEKTSYSGAIRWENDAGGLKGTRPEKVMLELLEHGNPIATALAAASSNNWAVTWNGLSRVQFGTGAGAVYSIRPVMVPDGYDMEQTASSEIKFTLLTCNVQVNVNVIGAPEGVNLDDLKIKVNGPDNTMPKEITYGAIKADRSIRFESVICGAYLAEEENASELVKDLGYVLDGENSHVCDAKYYSGKDGSTTIELNITIAYKKADTMAPEDIPDPRASFGNLEFEVLGPSFDGTTNKMTIKYSDFLSDGTYPIYNVLPGFYAVLEKNAETLVRAYSLRSDSVTANGGMVQAGSLLIISLDNHYKPAPTDERVDVPVIKTWNDNNNKDGNRPGQVTVRLLADGTEINTAVLNEDNGWSYTFTDLPRYTDNADRTEIVYTITEDAVPMYRPVIRGYSILNEYEPEVVNASVSKAWNDNGNAAGERPEGIAMSLSNGTEVVATVVLNNENGWSATVYNLPTIVNGQPATYTWTEQATVGYVQTNKAVDGANAVFTNALWERPPVEEAKKPKKAPGNQFFIFEEYETPLGVEIMINHVGDCFD